MSLLVVYLVPEGILFAADRNLSAPRDGRMVTVAQASKVLAWPDGSAILGYVGRASVEGQRADEWLGRFIDEHPSTDDLSRVCDELRDALECAMRDIPDSERGMIVHVAGFEMLDPGNALPKIFYVRDIEQQLDGSFKRLDGGFESRDELPEYDEQLGGQTGPLIRAALRSTTDEQPIPWFSFRQGFDLSVFSDLDRALWWFCGRLVAGVSRTRGHRAPTTIEEWAQFIRFSVLGYEAYFRAFYEPDQQPVGGDVDVVSIPWP